MKTMKKCLAVLLSVLCVCASFGVLAGAADSGESKTVSMLCYNVAGLPNIDYILGKETGVNVRANQSSLGKQLNATDYDVIAVQEDFNYHDALVSELTAFPNKTNHTGGVPGGDGMNVYARVPVYNEARTAWDTLYGVINDGADEMTPKGILYVCLDLGDGILVDLYDIHADAYDGEGSRAARRDNFRQLSEMIQKRGTDRPVIVTGDFNISVHHDDDNGLTDYLYDGCGLKDAWIETQNGGDYEHFTQWEQAYGAGWPAYWGVWDSVEKYLYRDGGGVSVTANSFSYKDFLNDDGASISDHKAAEASFTFTKTDDFKESDTALSVTPPDATGVFILKKLFVFILDFIKGLAHLNDLRAYLGF